MQKNITTKTTYNLCLFAVFAALIVIAMGAYTRLVEAGLGCPDWPTCYGHILWPMKDAEINSANILYAQTPVETDKTWPEQVHRLLASSLGLISLLVFFLMLRKSSNKILNIQLMILTTIMLIALSIRIVLTTQWEVTSSAMFDRFDSILIILLILIFMFYWLISKLKPSSESPVVLPAFIVSFVILQGLFGMWTVTLKVWPQVVTAHLLGGFCVISLFWLLSLRLKKKIWYLPKNKLIKTKRLKFIAHLALGVVILQVALGGWMTSNYAAVACPDFPTCQGELWPDMDFVKGFNVSQSIGPNYLGGKLDNTARIAIHQGHRIGALLTTSVLLVTVLLLTKIKESQISKLAFSIFFILSIQIGLGLSNIFFNFPLWVAVAHNIVGAVLLLSIVSLNYGIYSAKEKPNRRVVYD